MALELDFLSNKMEKLFNEVIIQEKVLYLENLKDDLIDKKELISKFMIMFRKIDLGKLPKKLLAELTEIETDFKQLYENFDDKLMIFIIGNGNVGKSTLLNALIGYEIAETNVLPNTWKIDIYSPEIEQHMALIKYTDGRQEKLPIERVKEIINQEEEKTKEGKAALNKNRNIALKGLRTKEEREETKRKLEEEYLYISNVSEVIWSVNKNLILEKCLLVDTPGLNQNLNSDDQIGDIHSYYHKADGVMWLLDGQTIASAKADNLVKELDTVLQNVGGLRDNIIGVINRIDKVRNNGGEEAVLNVCKDAKKNFGDKFSKLVSISAQQGIEGIKNNDRNLIEESGILNLQNTIRDIFISKSESVKNSAKLQGHNKLVNLTSEKLDKFQLQIEEHAGNYEEKSNKLKTLKKNLKTDINNALDSLFEAYLNEVKKRVDIYIDELAKGNGADFVKRTMYRLDDFIKDRDQFVKNKQLEIKNNALTWVKLCKLSEYKYIQDNDSIKIDSVITSIDLNLNSLNNIEYFTPDSGDDLFTAIGNMFGKIGFWFKKDGIKNKLNSAIRQECNKMKSDIIEKLEDNINKNGDCAKNVLNITFKNILFDFRYVDSVKEEIEALKTEMNKESEMIHLRDVLFGKLVQV